MSNLAADVPTKCGKCGQRLMLLIEGRDICERCRLGRTHEQAPENADAEPKEEAPPVPCKACNRTHDEERGYRIPLADGYCLSCRVLKRHET